MTTLQQVARARSGALRKYEKAALRWLERYLTEGSPTLPHFAEVTGQLARSLD